LGGVFFLLWFYFWRYFFGCGFEGVFWLYYYFLILGFFKITPQALPLLPRILCIQLFFKKVEHSPVYLEGRMELVVDNLTPNVYFHKEIRGNWTQYYSNFQSKKNKKSHKKT
jgi:hypothetical protein